MKGKKILAIVLTVLLITEIAASAVYVFAGNGRYTHFLHQGERLTARGKYEEAAEALTKAVELDGKNAEAYVSRGKSYLEAGQTGKAAEDFAKAVACDPGAWKEISLTLASTGTKPEDVGLTEQGTSALNIIDTEDPEASSGGSADITSAEAAASESSAASASSQAPSSQNALPTQPIAVAEGTATPEPEATPTPEPVDDSFEGLKTLLGSRTPATLDFVSSDVSAYPSVRIYFRASDGAGNPLVFQDGKIAILESVAGGEYLEREIKSLERIEGKQGISIELLADTSGSMDSDISKVQDVMSEFVRSLNYSVGDCVELMSFDSYLMYLCTNTSDVGLLLNGIATMSAYGNTALYDAIYEGIGNAALREGARCVICFTDGKDNASSHSYQEVVNLAQVTNVPVYIIYTSAADAAVIQEIAVGSGGYYWNINDLQDMTSVLSTIYGTQQDMYCAEYTSDAAFGAYEERSVEWIIADDTYCGTSQDTFTPQETLAGEHHNTRYELVKGDYTWTEANAACIAKGGHLATITSQAEMDELSAMGEAAGLKYIWIGGYTSERNGTAFGHWVTGENFETYTAWYPGEPSRNDLDGTPEMYLVLWCVQGAWSWNDERNDLIAISSSYSGKIGYICEYED